MYCQYCNQRLSIFKLLSGQPFCSKEHRELYLNTQSKDAIKRLLSSFSEEDASKQPLKPTAPPTSDAPAPAGTPVTFSVPEPSVPKPLTEVALVPRQQQPALEAPANDPPEASFIPQPLPAPRNRPATLIAKTVTQEPTAQVRLPVSPSPKQAPLESPVELAEPQARAEAEAEPEPPLAVMTPLGLDIPAASLPLEASPVTSVPVEPEENPPSIVSITVRRVVVVREAGLLSLPAGDAHPSETAAVVPEPEEIAVAPAPPALVASETECTPDASAPDVLTPPPPATAQIVWPEQLDANSLPAPPASVGSLRPRAAAPRTPAPAASPETHAELGAVAAILDLSQLASASTSLLVTASAPRLTAVEPCLPSQWEAATGSRSIAATATLFPVRISAPAAAWATDPTVAADWLIFDIVPRELHPAAFRPLLDSSTRRLAGPAALSSLKSADNPPALKAAPCIGRSMPLRTPAEARRSSSQFVLPWAPEVIPPAKESTRLQRNTVPSADLRPSLPGALSRVRLPQQVASWMSAPKLPGIRSFALSLPAGIPGPSLKISSLHHEILPTVVLAFPVAQSWRRVPAVNSTTFEIALRSSNVAAAAPVLTAPMASAGALRFATAPATRVATTTLCGAATALPVEAVPATTLELVAQPENFPWFEVPPRAAAVLQFGLSTWYAPLIPQPATTIRPLWSDATLVNAGWAGEQRNTQRLAHLLASRPSALSLMAAPQPRPLSSAAKLARLEGHAAITLSAAPGLAVNARLCSVATSARHLALPQPSRGTAALALPVFAAPKRTGLAPIRPAVDAATAHCLVPNRVVPASMPALPALSKLPLIQAATALPGSGPSVDPGAPHFGNAATQPSASWQVHTRIVAVLPWTARTSNAPSIGRADYSDRLANAPIPPVSQPSPVPAVSSRQRLARALTMGLRTLFP
jgi:hypothetical protein